MANAPGIEFHEKLSDLTECSICTEIFTNPRILPCVHTFCLHCLERYGKGTRPGNKMACPICRNEFLIPENGISGLPNNFFISKIVEIDKLATVAAKEAACQLCSEEAAVAKMFCIDCQQKICDRCILLHGRIKQCQSHQVVKLGSQLTVRQLNFCNSYCEHHPKELVKMYCYEDNVAICLICFAESHQSHRCSNVDKAAGQFTEQLKADLRKVSNRSSEYEDASRNLEKLKKDFTEDVLKVEESIRRSGAELKELVDRHTEMLIQNLKEIRDRNLKCIENKMQDVDRFKVMIDSYQKYCDELLTIGSPVDICRAAKQMHTRAIDLEEPSANYTVNDFNCDKVSFHCANVEILTKNHQTNNVVGELVTKSSDQIYKFQKSISERGVPVKWETMASNDVFKKIPLKERDQEYKDVARAIFSTAQSTVKRLVMILRIQNKWLYEQYVLRKVAMDAGNRFIQNERTLFHFTSSEFLDSINRNGFLRGNYEESGFLGTGFYFAKDFSYCAQSKYYTLAGDGLKYVYQCKVLTGEYVAGNQTTSVPSSKPGTTNLKYDSTVDNFANPSIFVVCRDFQAYPEYLIYFK